MPRKRAKAKASKQIVVARPRGPAARPLMSQISVPAAVSSQRRPRQIRFAGVSSGDLHGLTVTGTIPYYTIGAAVTSGAGISTLTGRSAIKVLRPTDIVTLTPWLALQAYCWGRYRVRHLHFIYNAIGSTASAVRLVFGYSSDPATTALSSVSSFSDYNRIQTVGSSLTFSPWKSWDLNVPVDNTWKYIDPVGSDSTIANIRQEAFGIIACVADADPGVTYTYGTLSVDFTVDFLDPTVLPDTSRPTTVLLQQELKSSQQANPLRITTLLPDSVSSSSSLPADVVVVDHPQSSISSRTPAPPGMVARRL